MAIDGPAKDQPIIVVGSGIFGLSTALHLAQRGYRQVTVFDKQPYDETFYSYFKGADAASADINKIVRSAYGSQTEYQDLSIEAIAGWHLWNDELATGKVIPPGMTKKDVIFIPNGNLSLSTAPTLPEWELACIDGMERAGHHNTQLATTDPRHRQVAEWKGKARLMDPFERETRGRPNVGVLDITGGTAVADKACRFALEKARKLGVHFVFGAEAGKFESLLWEENTVTGIKTADGKMHRAVMTVMACGGWTPVLLPQLDGLCEATAGSVALTKIPRESPLWERLGPDRFPTFTWNMRAGAEGCVYGFARDDDGWFKVGYRGTKYTNPVTQRDGKERSTPVTRWSPAHRDGVQPVGGNLTSFPVQARKVIQDFLDEVSGKRGLMVATGGSGHAFKYLPNIGNWVVDVMEQKDMERPAVKAWRWRTKGPGRPINDLMEGAASPRALGNIAMLEESRRAKL